jgi:hypothetical protein
MLLDFVIALVGGLLMDRAGFWYLKNTAGQFGSALPFTYRETFFPRVLVLICGCVLIAWGYATSNRGDMPPLMVLGLALFIAAHVWLYVKWLRGWLRDRRS